MASRESRSVPHRSGRSIVPSLRKSRSERRVVVTGIGIVTPFGRDLETFWHALRTGRSCISTISRMDTSDFPVHIGGQVLPVGPTPFLPEQLLGRNDLCTNIGLLAGGLALESSGLGALADEKRPISVMVGSAFGASQGLQDVYNSYFMRGWRKMHPLAVPRNMFNSLSSNLSIQYKLGGSHFTVAAACASGAVALGEAFRRIRYGEDAVVLAGGADAPICGSVLGGWSNLRVLSRNPDPASACRPFDCERDGLVISEAAAMLVLEDFEHARQRGARCYGEIAGYGATSDASHLTAPDPAGQHQAIERALHSAGLVPEDIDYVNAHGTSTKLNDEAETRALRMALGTHADHVAVSANKSMLGHTCWASPIVETIAGLLQMKHGRLHPTIYIVRLDPEVDLDVCAKGPVEHRIRYMLKNSFGFGGINACSLIRRYEG